MSKMTRKILATQIQKDMVLVCGEGIACKVIRYAIPIFHDGTIRVYCEHLYYPLIINEQKEVEVIENA